MASRILSWVISVPKEHLDSHPKRFSHRGEGSFSLNILPNPPVSSRACLKVLLMTSWTLDPRKNTIIGTGPFPFLTHTFNERVSSGLPHKRTDKLSWDKHNSDIHSPLLFRSIRYVPSGVSERSEM